MSGSSKKNHLKTRVSEIWLDEEGIMNIVFGKGVEINMNDMEVAYAYFEDLGFGPGKKKSRQLLSGGPFSMTKEARDYAGRTGTDFFVAAAMVSDSVVVRFFINLFNSVQKHNVPFKLFATEEEARVWLRSF